jgi:hypothetical protein
MRESGYKVPANPTVNWGSGWAVGLRTFAIIVLPTAGWIVRFDHSLWR